MTDKLNQTPQPELSERDAELLSAYLDDMLTAQERRDLEARLANEPFLRAELIAMRQTVAWMNALPSLKAPRDFTIRAEDVAPIKAEKAKVIPMQNRNWWLTASAAAIIIVVIGIVALLPALNNASGGSFEQLSDTSSEGVAFAPTEIASTSEAQVQAPDTINDFELRATQIISDATNTALARDGAAFTMADSDASADDSAQEPASANTAGNTNMQAPQEGDSAIALDTVVTTATALADLFASTPTLSMLPTQTAPAPSVPDARNNTSGSSTTGGSSSGGGTASDTEDQGVVALMIQSTTTAMSQIFPTATIMPSVAQGGALASTSDETSLAFSVGESQAETTTITVPTNDVPPPVPQTGGPTENLASRVEDADNESTEEPMLSEEVVEAEDAVEESAELVGTFEQDGNSSVKLAPNLIKAALDAMNAYIQGLQK